MNHSIKGKRALVTGANSGIGRGIAVELARRGAHVAINWVADESATAAVLAEIEAAGGRAVAVRADVSSESEVAAMFTRVVDALGGLDLLVNNAGLQRDAAFDELTLAQWQKVIDVNLTGQFLCAREAVRTFKRRGRVPGTRSLGVIIGVSSVHDLIPWAGHANYAASKGGVAMLMKTMAQELAPIGVRVNSVSPGAIRTPINTHAWSTPAALDALLELIPYKRIGEPDDVARAVAWLASDEADYVTGVTLYVDGGMTLYPEFADGG